MTHMQFDTLSETFLCAIILLQIWAPTQNPSIIPTWLGWEDKEPRLGCKHKANSINSFSPGGRKIPNNGCNHVRPEPCEIVHSKKDHIP